MSLCSDLRADREQLEYPLWDFLSELVDSGAHTTAEIETAVGCSYNLAYKKLTKLESLNVIKPREVGRNSLWHLNPAMGVAPEVTEASAFQNKLACIVIETLDSIASDLTTRPPLTGELPTECNTWLQERNMADAAEPTTVVARGTVFEAFLGYTLHGLYEPEHPNLDPINEQSDFPVAFGAAADVTGNCGFHLELPADTHTAITTRERETLLAVRSVLVATENPASTLTQVYERLFSQVDRRALGQFGTPEEIATLLADWAITDPDDTVLDPGVGAGMLSVAALEAKYTQGASSPLEAIMATDIDGLSVSMAAVALKLADGPGCPQLTVKDFLAKTPPDGSEGIDSDRTFVDAVVANPPYSRSQALSPAVKQRANQRASEETDIEFHGKSPLYVYFLAHAAQFVDVGGRLAFIIPSGFMETAFGVPFKKYLLESFQIEAIIQLDGENQTFQDVRTTASLVLLEAGSPDEDHELSFINCTEWPDIDSADELLALDFDDDSPIDGYRVDLVQALVSSEDNWKHYFAPTETDATTEVSEFSTFASIKRGIATGNNELFCLTDAQRQQRAIPAQYLKPIIKSAHDIPGFVIERADWEGWRADGKPIWLLYAYDGEKKLKEKEPLKEFLSYAETAYETNRKLLNDRNPWYCVDRREPAPILGKYMSRSGSQFIYNKAELLSLNNFHNITPEFSDERLVKALLAYLNSSIIQKEMSKLSRSYSGLEKIELRALKSAPVVDPRELETERVAELVALFETLEARERSGGDVAAVRSDIDAVVREILDVSVREDPRN